MCKAFSCIVEPRVDKQPVVHWKLGVDSHTDLIIQAGLDKYDVTSDPSRMMFARVEITPKNNNYLFPDEWILVVDEKITPNWFGTKHKEKAWAAHKKWIKQLDKILVRKAIVNPFNIEPPSEITKEHIQFLRDWNSVWNSVGNLVGNSVRDSVRNSVWAYIGTFFLLLEWKEKYPFKSATKLWNLGLVPSFDGITWRLHGGPKAAILFLITKEELEKVS